MSKSKIKITSLSLIVVGTLLFLFLNYNGYQHKSVVGIPFIFLGFTLYNVSKKL
jgi:hypothetical protein